MKIPLSTLYNLCRYQLQYVDSPDSLTVPVLLTKERADKFCDDFSVSKVILVPLYGEESFPVPGTKTLVKKIELTLK